MADRVGQQLGNYRLIRLLGQGGFAEVYLGEHMRLGMQAAIKVFCLFRKGRHGINATSVASPAYRSRLGCAPPYPCPEQC